MNNHPETQSTFRTRGGAKPAAADQELGDVVTLKRYCEITGDTPYAVHNRRRRGIWVDGIHCHVKSRRRLWINVAAVNLWVKGAA